ncbi:hypothetical protein RFM26_02720 [Mesorhizobium sp. VK23B]|uniref:Uncharacterized protein n=1 Tax=Mesorhizobium dulcispinae TaxID=3072316 RepID=A0ABU4X854_9HYPH|nr:MULTISPECIES: hypothetical protein [unclassified Mesorhizobium]MDX8464598.1 hypothetical protein [Mesorhizobium sp. VK23B]MDX8470984.1 hypothetical protein [Mesorhizobium sp. VK23A]
MNLLLAPPEIFSAHAITTANPGLYGHHRVEPETYLPNDGTFLRLYAGGGKSFPVAPFAVFQTGSNQKRLTAYSLDVRGASADPDTQTVFVRGGEDVWVGLNLPQSPFTSAVRVDLEVEGSLDWAGIYDQRGRLIYGRNQPGWSFSAPVIHRLRLRGDADVAVRIRLVDFDTFFGSRRPEGDEYTIGLPARFFEEPLPADEPHFTDPGIPVALRWYLGLHDANDGDTRLRAAAPLTTNRMDSPKGPFFGTDESGESSRVAALLKADENFWPRLFKLLNAGEMPPWSPDNYDSPITLPVGPTTQSAHLPRLGMLQMAAMDPGIAHFLGFSTFLPGQVPDLPRVEGADPGPASGWDTLGAIGLFALDPAEVMRRHLVVPDPQQDTSGILLAMLARALDRRCGGQDALALLEDQIRQVREVGAVPAVYATFASPVLPPLPPRLPEPQIVSHHWQQTQDLNPSRRYRAGFAFPRLPAVTLAATGRDIGDGNGPMTVHRPDGTGRVVPGIMGYEFEPNVRLRRFGERWRVQTNAGLLSDMDIDADWGEVSYFFSASDPFGRFGEPVECELTPPQRPKPRAPVLRSWIEPPRITDPPEMPGRLRIRVAIPSAVAQEPFAAEQVKMLGSAIVVPRIDELAAGSLELVRLELHFNGMTQHADLDTPGFIERTFDLPPLAVGGSGELELTATYLDSNDDAASDVQKIVFADRRPPPTHRTGHGLYWTSPPGPAPDVHVSIDWKGNPGSLYRVYLTDAVGLELSENIDDTKSRGDVADEGCRKAIQRPGDIKAANFRLLEKEATVAEGDGFARFRGKLPRSLSTVQFLKVVPVSKDGLEANFADCPIVPVAVPEGRRAPPPLLGGDIDPLTGRVRLVVTADGFSRERLNAEQPGLFAESPSGVPPEFRLRRAFGFVADPIYATPVHTSPMMLLDRNAAVPVFKGEWNEGADILIPFVRYTYWAEVRLPSEPRGPTGVPLGSPGDLFAPDEVSRQPHPRPFSPVSAPRQLMRIPDAAPAAPQASTNRAVDAGGNVKITVTLTNPPRAHKKAVDQYRLAVWWQWNVDALQAVNNANGAPLPEGSWPEVREEPITFNLPSVPGSLSSPLSVRVAYVDPLGRMGAIAKFPVAPGR